MISPPIFFWILSAARSQPTLSSSAVYGFFFLRPLGQHILSISQGCCSAIEEMAAHFSSAPQIRKPNPFKSISSIPFSLRPGHCVQASSVEMPIARPFAGVIVAVGVGIGLNAPHRYGGRRPRRWPLPASLSECVRRPAGLRVTICFRQCPREVRRARFRASRAAKRVSRRKAGVRWPTLATATRDKMSLWRFQK